MTTDLLSRESIIAALAAVATELVAAGVEAEIVVVGGAALALAYNARSATRDVDVLHTNTPAVWDAARRVAARLSLSPDWLNDHVRRVYTNDEVTRSAVLLQHPGLTVCAALPFQLLAMKLCAFRDDVDASDARLLLSEAPRHLDRETAWAQLERYLIRGRERFARENFDDLWEARHGSG